MFVAPENDTYWYYNALTRADIMISNGSAWLGYGLETNDIRGYNLANTDPNGPLFSATEVLVVVAAFSKELCPTIFPLGNCTSVNCWYLH